MATVLVACLWLGWVAREARIQRDCVRAIKAAGGIVWYDRELTEKKHEKRWPPSWLVATLGVDYFCDVTGVSLCGDRTVSDDLLMDLRRFKRLESLNLGGKHITDRSLVCLDGMPQLKWLSVHSFNVTDAGLAHFKGLIKLEGVELSNTEVSDIGLAHLKSLANLQEFCMRRTRITWDGISYLKRTHPGLEVIIYHP
jgi:internalin A